MSVNSGPKMLNASASRLLSDNQKPHINIVKKTWKKVSANGICVLISLGYT